MNFLRGLALTALISIANSPDSKGRFGEMIVKSVFQLRSFKQIEHYVINDIYFPVGEKKSAQIDHIYISNKGIFCIETKHINGLIEGDKDDPYWGVVLLNKSYKLYNPVRQNAKHVQVLEEFLKNKYKVYSLIVFTTENKPSEAPSFVINFSELEKYLQDYQSFYELSSEEMKEINELLINHKKTCPITWNEHVNNCNNEEEDG